MDDQEPLSLSTSLTGVAHILRDLTLEVPPYQRNYSWSSYEVAEFWDDLRAALATDRPTYFMGTVVLSGGRDGIVTVIDGQQRLATASMLLAAIRSEFVAREEPVRAQTIQARYLATASLRENVTTPRLLLNEADRHYFGSVVLGLDELPEVTSRPLIKAAFELLSTYVREDAEAAGPNWIDRLLRWIDLLDVRAKVIAVTVGDDADAFMIFETLNDRGLELTVGDVIKNYLLSLSRASIQVAQQDWFSMNHSLEENSQRVESTTYIRHWWNSRFGATRERDLYRGIRSEIRSEGTSLRTLQELAASAPIYAMLLNSDHELWGLYEPASRQTASLLVDLGLEQHRPLALAVLEKFPPNEVDETLRSILAWSVRGIVVGGIGGGSAERSYAEAAVRVTNGRSRDAMSIFSDIEPMIAGDEEFVAAFAQRRVLRTSYFTYLLRAVASGTLLPTPDFGDLVAVGFFPRIDRAGTWWMLVEEDERLAIVARLGNFGLFPRALTKDIPEDPRGRLEFFRENDQLSARLGIPWTDSFDRFVVDVRQRALADAAVQIWPALPSGVK